MPNNLLLYILIMAGVTYLIRMLPLALWKKEVKNVYVRSFLYYVPYACLAAMTFPAIFYSTGSLLSAAVGLAVAMVLAWKSCSLIVVSLAASLAAFLVSLLPF